MRRRAFLGSVAATALAPALRAAAQGTGAEPLIDIARALASRPFEPNTTPLPPPFADLDYDAFRGIRPITGKAAGLPLGDDYLFDLLPPGLYFPDPVRIETVTSAGIRQVAFSPSLFDFEPRYFDSVPDTAPGAGFTGVRLRHPLNSPDVMDEVLVLQGASYFRAIGRQMVYGLSARAVALGTGGAAPEEFPRFTHLRLYEPDDGGLRIEGVIDSPSLAGHCDMRLRPGAETVTELTVTLFPRVEIATVGIAPLTSMYLKGPLRAAVSDDFRPRVHDSDVLVIENGAGETLWRPISNPARIETSAFADDGPAGFGLYQTDRGFEAFQDTEARYHDRPSAMVRPREDWGPGAVVLVEITTPDEFMDNIVAFWRPEAPLAAGSAHRFRYDLIWTIAPPDQPERVRILQTRSGREHDKPGTLRYVVDFTGTPDGLTPEIGATPSTAEISGASLFALPEGRGMRATFLLTPGTSEAAELRLVLRDEVGHAASPTWLHRWTPARDGGV